MAEAVKALPQEILDIVEVSEWDLRTRDGISRFTELKARSLPSIALNNELVFEAIIPPQGELIAAIMERYESKKPPK